MIRVFKKSYIDLFKVSKYTLPLIVSKASKARCSSFTSSQLKDFRYSDKHEWVKLSENIATVGISDYAQHSLGTIVYVQLPENNSHYKKDDEIGCVESTKSASNIYVPISGEVIEVNEKLESQPSLINESCYENGWIYKLKVDDVNEVNSLMTHDKYQDFIKGLEE